MRSINIDLKQAIATAYKSGQLTIEDINEALADNRGLNMPCGFAAGAHGHFYSLFFSTDKESGQVNRSKDGKRIKLNLRASAPDKKKQEAQTPGKVLPQNAQAGVPQLTAEQVAALQTLQALGVNLTGQVQAQAAPVVRVDETDFSKL